MSAISSFIEEHYKHFNAAALVDAAKGYKHHLAQGKKMLVSMAGAMSTSSTRSPLSIRLCTMYAIIIEP